MTPIISLVSGTYNRLELLKAMVQSFRDNLLPGLPYEIVIVDGGSTDGTIEWCTSQSDIILIEDNALLGAISAFTRGAFKAQGKYILLSNDDVTFWENSILPAITHLENNLKCGAVAYKDNRPMGAYTRDVYKVNSIGGLMDGRRVPLIYAQVGLFRKWLGDKLNWWLGEHEEMLGASTYGGDNTLSAQIWKYGYSVDEVEGCTVEDHIANDELRQINYHKGLENDDSVYFTKQFDWSHGGIIVPSEPQLPQQNKRAARILYLPVYEPGWTTIQKHPIHGKHGLLQALARGKNKHGTPHIVQELDYLAIAPNKLRAELFKVIDSFQPDLILTQIQSWQPITASLLAEIRSRCGATIVNWNGDQAPGGLASKEMLDLLRYVDLQLITNLDVVPTYNQMGIKWAYWQIGYEDVGEDYQQKANDFYHEIGRESPFDSDPHWPVVFLASLRTAERRAISDIVTEFGGKTFSPGDEFASLYNFSVTKAIYNRAKVIISDNGFTSRGFVSNRLFQALASGGGVVLQQHVDGLDELTGLIANKHYIEWQTLDDLREWIEYCSLNSGLIQLISNDGTAFVRENFSFDAQVAKLMALIKERLGESEQMSNSVALIYRGRNTHGFGLGNMFPSGTRYEYTPGKNLYVHRVDVDAILNNMPGQWEKAEME